MDTEHYKERLRTEERRLMEELERAGAEVREAGGDLPVGDAADASVRGEEKEELSQQLDLNRALLLQVRDALQRLADGTYGKCVVDGGSIDEKRLEAMPWTPYCIRHQRPIEIAHPPRTSTL